MVIEMVYCVFLVLLFLWGIGSQCISRFGLKTGSLYLTGVTFAGVLTCYLVGIFYNFGLYNTEQFSAIVLLSYLLAAILICFFLIPLSLAATFYLPAVQVKSHDNSAAL